MSKQKTRRRLQVSVRVSPAVKEELELRAAERNVALAEICREILEAEVLGYRADDGPLQRVDETESELLRVAYFIELCQLDDLRDAYPNEWQERAHGLSTLSKRAQRQTLNGDGPPDLIDALASRRRRRKQGDDYDNNTASRPSMAVKRTKPARPKAKPESVPVKPRTPSEARMQELRNALLPKKYRD